MSQLLGHKLLFVAHITMSGFLSEALLFPCFKEAHQSVRATDLFILIKHNVLSLSLLFPYSHKCRYVQALIYCNSRHKK
jgi:hypothetical protein